jgi:hypothetical protein
MRAKTDLKFIDIEDDFRTIKVNVYQDGEKPKEIRIEIEGRDYESIYLDISTAIKFAKTLRTEINRAKEVNNG